MRRLRHVGCPTVAASTVSARRACQRCASSARPGSERPRPRLQRHAPRLGGILDTGNFARSPLGTREVPHGSRLAVCSVSLHRIRSDSMWPIVPAAGRLPARHRGDRDTALDCAFRRPRRRQPTTLPVAALWRAAPYHGVTKASRALFLAIPLPLLARRPFLAPVTTRFSPIRPRRQPGSDRRRKRPEPPPGCGLRKRPRGASRRLRPAQRSARHARGHDLCAIAGARLRRNAHRLGPDLAKPRPPRRRRRRALAPPRGSIPRGGSRGGLRPSAPEGGEWDSTGVRARIERVSEDGGRPPFGAASARSGRSGRTADGGAVVRPSGARFTRTRALSKGARCA